MFSLSLLAVALSGAASAYVDEKCQDVADGGVPEGYSEQGQQDYLLNFFSLATTLSPLHGPVPNEPGHGSVGLELAVIPPLSCEHRLVLNYTKTEDTNKAPVMPRFRVQFTFPPLGKMVPYGGLAYVPPVTVFGTRNVIVSGETGISRPFGEGWAIGGRGHATLMKSVAEIATPFDEGDTAYNDFYVGSTFGLDLLAGKEIKGFTPYVALGYTDVSTFFYIGDDGVVTNNGTPYAGLTHSLGLSVKKIKHVDLAAEYYGAPYNFNKENAVTGGETSPGAHLHTGRARIAYRW